MKRLITQSPPTEGSSCGHAPLISLTGSVKKLDKVFQNNPVNIGKVNTFSRRHWGTISKEKEHV